MPAPLAVSEKFAAGMLHGLRDGGSALLPQLRHERGLQLRRQGRERIRLAAGSRSGLPARRPHLPLWLCGAGGGAAAHRRGRGEARRLQRRGGGVGGGIGLDVRLEGGERRRLLLGSLLLGCRLVLLLLALGPLVDAAAGHAKAFAFRR
jgi:hypothetical protein